jgi:hypothetical protein
MLAEERKEKNGQKLEEIKTWGREEKTWRKSLDIVLSPFSIFILIKGPMEIS